ncbi:hypothetical protein [Mediterraneibacter gnavus]|uniref:hypothetical protein n=1 Tax=Mediterraneibacter gnavus TaxID=33038 RepID=UPI0036D244DC
MDVEARIYLPEKPLENVWGYGEVTVEGLFTFQVRLLNYQKESGEETSFVSFPRRKVQGTMGRCSTSESGIAKKD